MRQARVRFLRARRPAQPYQMRTWILRSNAYRCNFHQRKAGGKDEVTINESQWGEAKCEFRIVMLTKVLKIREDNIRFRGRLGPSSHLHTAEDGCCRKRSPRKRFVPQGVWHTDPSLKTMPSTFRLRSIPNQLHSYRHMVP
jgi:hypothetical protein